MPASKSTTKKLSPALTEELCHYFATHHAARLSRNLRCMLLDYLAYELRVGVPLYLEEMLWQLHDLFELLDRVEEETKGWLTPFHMFFVCPFLCGQMRSIH